MTLVQRGAFVAAAAAVLALGCGNQAAWAQSAPTPPPSPSPAPSPTAAPTPVSYGTIGGALGVFGFHSNNPNATGALDTANGNDLADRADLSNLLVNAAYTSGLFRAAATVGGYNFLTVGQAINSTFQHGANTNLYTVLPLVSLQYASKDGHVTVIAGKLPPLLGQESNFTYQNVNIERGLGWSLEPVVSRGVHVGYVNGAWSAAAEENDGYYSGTKRALEYSLAWAPSSATTLSFASIVPNRDTPPNPTAAIANKAEYNLMYSHTIGKLQLSPYLLLVSSPASAALGYAQNESAFAAVLLGAYAFTSQYSVGFRYENVADRSSTSDMGLNADLLGYGPGSAADTYTLTPTYKSGNVTLRVEYAHVVVRNAAAGLAFGSQGTLAIQNRFGFEIGATR